MTQGSSSIKVELVYDRDCPNLERARAIIRTALEESRRGASLVRMGPGRRRDPGRTSRLRLADGARRWARRRMRQE